MPSSWSSRKPESLPWQEQASKKRFEIRDSIPHEWLLDPATLHEAKKRQNLTGTFIESLLEAEVCDIANNNSLELVTRIRDGTYTALQVTRAFCNRAVVAQQLLG